MGAALRKQVLTWAQHIAKEVDLHYLAVDEPDPQS